MKHISFLLILTFCLYETGSAQILDNIKKAKDKVTAVTVDKLSRDPVTTSFKDVDKIRYIPDTFGNDEVYANIHEQPFKNGQGFTLAPGYYEGIFESYCIKAGTRSPTSGNGRFYSPLKGPKADIFSSILQGRYKKKVTQRQAQLLMWAIIAKADFRKMKGDVKITAVKLLSPAQIARLNKSSLDALGSNKLKKLTYQSKALRAVIETENKMRHKFYQGANNYDEMVELVMLDGIEPLDRDYVRGRWVKHEEGYFIRHFPVGGYSSTKAQIYIPSEIGMIYFDGEDDVACPASTGGQRLMQSNVPYGIDNWPDILDNNTDEFLACDQVNNPAIDAIIHDEMIKQNITGMAVGVISKGEFVHLSGYGHQDLGRSKDLTHKTVMRWASISKPVTALATFQLADADSDFAIGDLVTDHLNYWPTSTSDGRELITIQNLMNNRSGINQYSEGKRVNSCSSDSAKTIFSNIGSSNYSSDGDNDGYNGQSAASIFQNSVLDFSPGTQYLYSSYGFNLLGSAIDAVAPNGYYNWVMDSIAKPLNMRSFKTGEVKRKGFNKEIDGVLTPKYSEDLEYKLPSGGWESNVCDLARFAEGLMNNSVLPNNPNALWMGTSRTSCPRWWDYINGIYQQKLRNSSGTIVPINMFYHGGDHNNLTTNMEFYPNDSLIVVIQIPTKSMDRRRIVRRIFNTFGKTWNVNDSVKVKCSDYMESSGLRFSGVWRQTNEETILRRGYLHDDFYAEWKWMREHGYYCDDFEAKRDGNGDLRWDGVFKKGTGRNAIWRHFDYDGFKAKWDEMKTDGMQLIDLETYKDSNGKRRWAGLFRPKTGKTAMYRGQTFNEFADKREDLAGRGYKLIDIETYIRNGTRNWAGVWIEGEEGKLNRGKNTAEFGELRETRRANGYKLIDIETYTHNGERKWAGIWEKSTENERLNRTWNYCDLMDKHDSYMDVGYELIDWEIH